jgi:hypothetical protein
MASSKPAGAVALELEEYMAKKAKLEPIPDPNIKPMPTRPLSGRAVQALQSHSVRLPHSFTALDPQACCETCGHALHAEAQDL